MRKKSLVPPAENIFSNSPLGSYSPSPRHRPSLPSKNSHDFVASVMKSSQVGLDVNDTTFQNNNARESVLIMLNDLKNDDHTSGSGTTHSTCSYAIKMRTGRASPPDIEGYRHTESFSSDFCDFTEMKVLAVGEFNHVSVLGS